MENRFLGKTCPYCKAKFQEDDVIVVCSVCEMPHHLSCWQENNGCTTFGCTGNIKEMIGNAASFLQAPPAWPQQPDVPFGQPMPAQRVPYPHAHVQPQQQAMPAQRPPYPNAPVQPQQAMPVRQPMPAQRPPYPNAPVQPQQQAMPVQRPPYPNAPVQPQQQAMPVRQPMPAQRPPYPNAPVQPKQQAMPVQRPPYPNAPAQMQQQAMPVRQPMPAQRPPYPNAPVQPQQQATPVQRPQYPNAPVQPQQPVPARPGTPVQGAPRPAVPAQRYQTLYENEPNTVQGDTPVLIEKISLIKDYQTGGLMGRCSFRNLADKAISAMLVDVNCIDVWGKTLGRITGFQFLDLNAAPDTAFGQAKVFSIPDLSTRALDVVIKKVLFSDRTVIDAAPNRSVLPKQVPLASYFGSEELAREYVRELGRPAIYAAVDGGAFWRCTCGAINPQAGENCRRCGAEKRTLLKLLDPALISSNLDAYRNELKSEAEDAPAEPGEQPQ